MAHAKVGYRLATFVLDYVRPIIDGLGAEFQFDDGGNYVGYKPDEDRHVSDQVPTLYVWTTEITSRLDGYHFAASFSDNGPIETRMKRLGGVLATLAVSRYADIHPKQLPCYVRLSDDIADLGLRIELVVPRDRLSSAAWPESVST